MAVKKTGSLAGLLSDKFSDVWKLLSETTVFLSRTREFDLYEEQLRSWRSDLQSAGRNTETAQRIRSELTELRKQLRVQGYDLSLGKQHLIIDGFRNDACLGEGFRRAVIFIAEKDIFSITGDDNHIVLAEHLERRVQAETVARKTRVRILDRHYLWYRRDRRNLILSGADTETREDFARFAAMCRANSLLFLSGLKNLR
jgi:hypothetical protein